MATMSSIRRFRLGLIVIGSAALFVAMLWFVVANSLQGQHVSYFVRFEENVKGMVLGSKVNFQGVPLGVVRDIRFQEGRTFVELSVDPTRGVIQDVTRARLDRLLVTGQVTVELEGWAADGKALRPRSFIEPKPDAIQKLTRSLPEIIEQVAGLLSELDVAARNVNRVLGDSNQAALARILANTEHVTAELPERLRGATDRFDALVAQARSAVGAVERAATMLAESAGPEATALLAQARGNLAELQIVQGEMSGAAREARALLAGLRAPTQSALQSMRTTLDDVRAFARQLRLAPDSLFFGVSRSGEPAAAGGER
jgi:phospholipid/cholesterol/gamma-HCH transport system substrate-binding protein